MNNIIPLSFVDIGDKVVIDKISGGDNFSKKMMEMGFNRGAEIIIVSNNNGPIIVRVGESRVALGRGMAQKIMVKASYFF